MHRKIIVIATIALLTSASLVSISCAESTDGVTPIAADASSLDAATGQAGDSASTSSDGTSPTDAPSTGTSSVLINELSPSDEWVELVSSGSGAVDVSGFRVSDSDKDGGGPKLKDSVVFPGGTILSPKAYVIVQGGGLDGGGKHCPDGGQSYCFNAEFGVSNKAGETIYLLDKGGAVVGSAVYPAMAAPSGDSWGRLPSGDPKGAFSPNLPTPGAANAAK